MKKVLSYTFGFFLLATAAQAAPQSAKQINDRKVVNLARVKLMNDVRLLGPDSPQVQQDKEALVSAIEKLQGDSAVASRSVDVKRNPKTAARAPHKARKTKSAMVAKGHARRTKHKPASRKISHLRSRKHSGTV